MNCLQISHGTVHGTFSLHGSHHTDVPYHFSEIIDLQENLNSDDTFYNNMADELATGAIDK